MIRGLASPLVAALSCLSLTACVSLGPRANPSRFFTLTPARPPEQATAGCSAALRQLALGVGPITLPGYLDRQQLVTRLSANRLAIAENDRWAEPLEDNFGRVLAENLSVLLANERVVLYPWQGEPRPSHHLEVEVLQFEVDTALSAELYARWILRDVATGEPLSVKEELLSRPVQGASTEASVAALSELLGDLSCEIVKDFGRPPAAR